MTDHGAREVAMEPYDDDLKSFEEHGAPPLPVPSDQGYVDHDGARIWYSVHGAGPTVILLHGGLGHSGNWGNQVPMLVDSGHRAVLIDSRGHGRSTRDSRPYMYELMASDVLAVMDTLRLEEAALVGWSDGACTALILAMQAPTRVAGVFFFGCNMDPGGTKDIAWPNPILNRCLSRHAKDYARLSATPDQFKEFTEAVGQMMKSQPNTPASDLAAIRVPVSIVQSEHDEFIKLEHAHYLARTIPGAHFILLPGVSHFAPLQRPDQFNSVMRSFLGQVLPGTAP
jgi:pimeloyl-ACP methyl ester carboxylesterase